MLLQSLLTHAVPSAEAALRAEALGVPLERRTLVAVVLRLRPVAGLAVLAAQARLRDAAESAAFAARDSRLPALVGAVDDATVGVLLALRRPEDVEPALEALSTALRRRLESGRTPVRADEHLVAVGSVVPDVRHARRSFLEAAQVADAAGAGPGTAAPAYYRLPDVRLRGLLHLLRDDERLQTYTERELGALLAHDSARGSDLLGVLRTYLAHGRNKSAAADAAHLSRPSFYERLHKVERVLGVDLGDVESCLSLHVALLALDVLPRAGTAPARA